MLIFLLCLRLLLIKLPKYLYFEIIHLNGDQFKYSLEVALYKNTLLLQEDKIRTIYKSACEEDNAFLANQIYKKFAYYKPAICFYFEPVNILKLYYEKKMVSIDYILTKAILGGKLQIVKYFYRFAPDLQHYLKISQSPLRSVFLTTQENEKNNEITDFLRSVT